MKKELKVLEKRAGVEGFRFIFGKTPRDISLGNDNNFYIRVDLKKDVNSWYIEPEKGNIEDIIFKELFGDEKFMYFKGNNLNTSDVKLEEFISNMTQLENVRKECVTDIESGVGDWTWVIVKGGVDDFEKALGKVKENMVEDLFDGKVPTW